MTSTRRQDLDQLRWLTGEKFATYIEKVGVLAAASTVGALLSVGSRPRDDARSDPLHAFGAEGRLVDFAPGLEYGPGHGTMATIVTAFLAALHDEAGEPDMETVVAALIASVSHPDFWCRLLTAVREKPRWQIPVAAALASGSLLANRDTRAAGGELMRVLSPSLDPEQHSRLLEEPIRRASALLPDAAHAGEAVIDQLVGYLDVTRLQDGALRERLAGLLDGDGPPAIPERPRFSVQSQRSDLAAFLGRETYDALGEDARAAVDELRLALESVGDTGPDARLEAAFARTMTETGDVAAAKVRELTTRAAASIAGSPRILPDTDLGQLVIRVLLDGTAASGAER